MSLTTEEQIAFLRELADNRELMEIARKAIEDELVDRRERCWLVPRNNGFSIRHRDGSPSTVIRLESEQGIRLALRAIATYLSPQFSCIYPGCTAYYDKASSGLDNGDGSLATGWFYRPGGNEVPAHDHKLADQAQSPTTGQGGNEP